MTVTFRGKMGTFGGPKDRTMGRKEGLALVDENNKRFYAAYLLADQPKGTTGLARRLNPDSFYLACRWDYKTTPRTVLFKVLATVTNPANNKSAQAKPVDWGPHDKTSRVADLSPGLAKFLGLNTDDEVVVTVVVP